MEELQKLFSLGVRAIFWVVIMGSIPSSLTLSFCSRGISPTQAQSQVFVGMGSIPSESANSSVCNSFRYLCRCRHGFHTFSSTRFDLRRSWRRLGFCWKCMTWYNMMLRCPIPISLGQATIAYVARRNHRLFYSVLRIHGTRQTDIRFARSHAITYWTTAFWRSRACGHFSKPCKNTCFLFFLELLFS